jgi:chromosome segregation ATPase
MIFVQPVKAIDYMKKSSPTLRTVSTNTVLSSAKYTEWKNSKSQIQQTSPYFSYDVKWKANLPKLNTSLERIDSILTKVKKSSDAYMIANKSYFKNLASELLVLEKAIDDLEEQLANVGDDAQLANTDLQNWLQKQQQTLQTLSNVSKMLHDTAMAIIRKIG